MSSCTLGGEILVAAGVGGKGGGPVCFKQQGTVNGKKSTEAVLNSG